MQPAIPTSNRIIENPATGERIVVRRTAAETGGALLQFELFLAPGGRVPSGHAHPEQEERFTVLEGRMRFRIGLRRRVVAAGESVTVAPGRSHSFANAGARPARVSVEVRPALHMQELLEVAAAISGEPRPRAFDLALFLHEFRREVAIPFLPAWLGRAVAGALARLARHLRADARYRDLRASRP